MHNKYNNIFKTTSGRILSYYAILLVVYMLWTNLSAPPAIMRVAYLCAAVLPTYSIIPRYVPFVVTLFDAMVHYGFAYSFMPFQMSMYYAITVIGLMVFMFKVKNSAAYKIPLIVVVLIFYILAVETLISGEMGNNTKTFLMVMAFLFFFSRTDNNATKDYGYVFVFLTLALSILFLTHGKDYSVDISLTTGESFERSGWEDPNYWGCVVGMGALVSLYNITHPRYSHFSFLNILFAFLILLTIVVLVRNASRGAIVSLGSASCYLIFRTKLRSSWRFLIIVAIVALVYYLYTSSLLEFLIYRFSNDDGTGGERTLIWEAKYNAFSASSIFHQLFGYGRELGVALVNGKSFHNDFLAHFVEYGLIGGFLFVIFFFLPIIQMRGNKDLVIPIMIYLFLTCMLLEPFAAGRPVYFAFWLFAYLMSRIPDISQLDKS